VTFLLRNRPIKAIIIDKKLIYSTYTVHLLAGNLWLALTKKTTFQVVVALPNSNEHFLRLEVAQDCIMVWPISVEPVKPSFLWKRKMDVVFTIDQREYT
jgi:hypothetical protein